jgi:hypothetical protein
VSMMPNIPISGSNARIVTHGKLLLDDTSTPLTRPA